MRCTHCEKCCEKTEMELCQADILRLERRGYKRGDFCLVGEDRIPRLKNVEDYCFFYDRGRKRCTEYASRPLGCAIYPVNLATDGAIVLDESCPAAASVTHEEMISKGQRLQQLLMTIDMEAQRNI